MATLDHVAASKDDVTPGRSFLLRRWKPTVCRNEDEAESGGPGSGTWHCGPGLGSPLPRPAGFVPRPLCLGRLGPQAFILGRLCLGPQAILGRLASAAFASADVLGPTATHPRPPFPSAAFCLGRFCLGSFASAAASCLGRLCLGRLASAAIRRRSSCGRAARSASAAIRRRSSSASRFASAWAAFAASTSACATATATDGSGLLITERERAPEPGREQPVLHPHEQDRRRPLDIVADPR